MAVRGHPALSLSRQGRLLSIGRSALYCAPLRYAPRHPDATQERLLV